MTPSEAAVNSITPLTIQTLGQFVVTRDKERLPDNAWGREKARQLFQYLITHRQHFTAKERIIDDLWPELDPERADRDFKVALNALNSALQPDRAGRGLSIYIARQGTTYGLEPAAPVLVDVDEFQAQFTAASQAENNHPGHAVRHYRQALQYYRGDYLPDTLYQDWASAERERLATLYLTAATRLAGLLLAENEIMEMTFWSQLVIAADSCWEEAYRLLMRGHMASGNRPLALRVYQQCRTALAEELGIEPMAETTRLFEQIASSNG
jgi:LuxR family transcriptional regulator, maltose regulon positive regulatory protein